MSKTEQTLFQKLVSICPHDFGRFIAMSQICDEFEQRLAEANKICNSADQIWCINNERQKELESQVDGMKERLVEAERDARRYRAFLESGFPVCFLGQDYRNKPALDAAIDDSIRHLRGGTQQ